MTKFAAYSEILNERTPWLPSFDLAANSRPGQMPDVVLVEIGDNSWNWHERIDGEWVPVIGGFGSPGCTFMPWDDIPGAEAE